MSSREPRLDAWPASSTVAVSSWRTLLATPIVKKIAKGKYLRTQCWQVVALCLLDGGPQCLTILEAHGIEFKVGYPPVVIADIGISLLGPKFCGAS
jgi:hypothetical protein